jgi:hypothetical protein
VGLHGTAEQVWGTRRFARRRYTLVGRPGSNSRAAFFAQAVSAQPCRQNLNWVRFVDGFHFFARERREEVRLLGY